MASTWDLKMDYLGSNPASTTYQLWTLGKLFKQVSLSPSQNGDDDDDTFTKEITSCLPKTYASSSIV